MLARPLFKLFELMKDKCMYSFDVRLWYGYSQKINKYSSNLKIIKKSKIYAAYAMLWKEKKTSNE